MRAVPMLAVYGCVLFAGSPTSVVGQGGATQRVGMSSPVYLIIRADDAGMSHSVNLALQRLIDARLPLSVSVMFPCPWYQETVEILKRHPEVAVGIHLTLNSEWKNYRWGPVSGREAVPTLVDSIRAPSFSYTPPVTILPPKIPIEPVSVDGSATMTCAGRAM